MIPLLIGLIVFLGVHSVRIVAEEWRTAQIARNPGRWKGLYSLLSAVGLVLIVWGYGLARSEPVVLWGPPPVALRHVASLLMLLSFVLLAAAYVPRNGIKARLGHPMVLGVKVWALAHLIANNTLADLLLFGSFLVWAVADFRSARRRDRVSGAAAVAGTTSGTAIAVVVGAVAWVVFVFWAHAWLIGIRPFG